METEPINFQVSLPDYLAKGTARVAEESSQASLAAEDFISPELSKRISGFTQLDQLRAFNTSPLHSYLLVTRITEPNLELRRLIVEKIADLLSEGVVSDNAFAPVRKTIVYHLSQMRTRQIYALLQLAVQYPDQFTKIALVLKECSFAGNQLAQIAENRDFPLSIRRQAIMMIQSIGYTVAIASLDRLLRRFEMKYPRSFEFQEKGDVENSDASLIPLLRETLDLLKSP